MVQSERKERNMEKRETMDNNVKGREKESKKEETNKERQRREERTHMNTACVTN